MSLPVADDDGNNNDQTMIKDSNDLPLSSSFDNSLHQLCHSVRALEKVNQQFTQFLDTFNEQAPCQTIIHLDTILQHLQPCPAPQLKCTLPNILPKMLPDLAEIIWKQPLPPQEPQIIMMDHDHHT